MDYRKRMLAPLEPTARARLESEILPRLLTAARWYRAKSRPLARVEVAREVILGDAARLLWVRCAYEDAGPEETYLFPASPDGGAEATADPALHPALLQLVLSGGSLPGSDGGRLVGRTGQRAPAMAAGSSRLLGLEQSNTSILFEQPSGRLFLKLYRQAAAGKNPDAELIAHLSERAGFTAVPAYVGALEYEPPGGGPAESVGLLQEFVSGRSDAWEFVSNCARTHLDGQVSDAAFNLPGLLGRETARLHAALATGWDDPAENAAPLVAQDFARLTDRLEESLGRLQRAGSRVFALPPALAEEVRAFLDADGLARLRAKHAQHLAGAAGGELPKTRIHGDFHLGQILFESRSSEFVFLDFEGEPARSAEERRRHQSPLIDVAGMMRSFAYAGAFAAGVESGPDRAALGDAWGQARSEHFCAVYQWFARQAGLLGKGDAWRSLLNALILEKACYELAYELDNRPAWVPIPLAGIQRLLAAAPLS